MSKRSYLPMITVLRRDLLDTNCLCCADGVYAEVLYAETVYCELCGDEPPRWMTKAEILERAQQ